MTGFLLSMLVNQAIIFRDYTTELLGLEGTGTEIVRDITGEVNEDIIVNGYFDWVQRIGRIVYSPGCAGTYTNCKRNVFDCSGLIRGWAGKLGIFNDKQLGHNDSTTLFAMGKKKAFSEARRGDFVLFLAIPGQVNESGEVLDIPNHIAVVTRIVSGTVFIMDAYPGPYARERELTSCKRRVCTYAKQRRLHIATNGLLALANQKGLALQKYDRTRALADVMTKRYLARKGKSELTEAFFSWGAKAGIKPEVAVCIANSETGLGRNVSFTGNIGNVGAQEYENLELGIRAIYFRSLNGRHLGAKRYIGDLYTNGDCKIQCRRFYARGKGAQHNVLSCLSQIYNQNIGPDFSYRM